MDRERRTTGLWWCALVALALLSWGPSQLEDTWFYAATGRWVIDNQSIPRSDPFSWTVSGEPWQSNGWLWGVALWGLWSVGGHVAIAAIKPVFVLVSGVTIRWSAVTLGATRASAMVAALLGTAATFPFLVERPQLTSYLGAPLAIALTHRWLADPRRWLWLATIPVLFAVWTNLHSVALSAVPLVAATAFGLAIDRRSARSIGDWLRASGVTAAAALGTLVNPWGAGLWAHAADVRSISRGTISEWEPLWRRGAGGWIALALIVGVVVLALRWGALQRLTLLGPLVLAGVLAIDAIRSFPIFAVVAATVVAPLTPAIGRLSADRLRLLTVGAVSAVAVAVIVAVPRVGATTDPADGTPVDPVAALPGGCRLVNDYLYGNWVMFDRSDILVSDDGRNDLYGRDDPRSALLADPSSDEGLVAWTDQNAVDCALVRSGSPSIESLTGAGWTVIGDDGNAVALVRE